MTVHFQSEQLFIFLRDLQLVTMTAVISNFAKADTGDPQMYSGNEMRERIFSSSDGGGTGTSITTNADHEVMFSPTTPVLTAGYADRTLANAPVCGATPAAALNGIFVGSSSDGPLGVLGRYSIGADSSLSFVDGTNDRADVSIDGAFGADLP